MSGNTDDAHIWGDADVYVSFDLDATRPATVDDDFSEAWDHIGLLDGDEGFVHGRSETIEDKYAWGGRLVRRSYRNAKETHKFTAFEWNATTRRLWNRREVDDGVLIVPAGKPESVQIAFVARDAETGDRIRIYDKVEIVVDGDVTEKEADIASITWEATVFPDNNGVSGIELLPEPEGS